MISLAAGFDSYNKRKQEFFDKLFEQKTTTNTMATNFIEMHWIDERKSPQFFRP